MLSINLEKTSADEQLRLSRKKIMTHIAVVIDDDYPRRKALEAILTDLEYQVMGGVGGNASSFGIDP